MQNKKLLVVKGPTSVDIHPKIVCLRILGGMLLPQAVQDVCSVQAGVVTELPGDDLQSLGKGVDEQLRLAGNGPRMIPQIPARHSSSCADT